MLGMKDYTQLCRDYFVNHDIDQPVFLWKVRFFCHGSDDSTGSSCIYFFIYI